MSPLNRISKTTLFAAAAAFGLSAAFAAPANAALVFDTTSTDTGTLVEYSGTGSGTSKSEYSEWNIGSSGGSDEESEEESGSTETAFDFTLNITGDLAAVIGVDGEDLYNLHSHFWSTSYMYAIWSYVVVDADTGTIIDEDTLEEEGISPSTGFGTGNSTDLQTMMNWTSGEVRIESGTLELYGYVNVWLELGDIDSMYGDSGTMLGATRITVTNDGVLDISGNSNFDENDSYGYMISAEYGTTYQFLHNLIAGDLGTDSNATLITGDSSLLMVDIHIDAWDGLDRTVRSDGTYLDNTLAFGGSIGVIDGAADIYKTGDGDFTILNTSAGFTGSLYVAGGSLILAGENTAGSSLTYDVTDIDGNIIWSTQLNYTIGNAHSVNIAGSDGGRGTAVDSYSTVESDEIDDTDYEYYYTVVKEAYFPDVSVGTLVIATNQVITNFQSYFNGGYAVDEGEDVDDAIALALDAGDLLPFYDESSGLFIIPGQSEGLSVNDIVATLPVISGTGEDSTIVLPGGNYVYDSESGEWIANTVSEGSIDYIQGGVLLIVQEEGMGGVYTGSIVGASVKIYDKVAFAETTEENESVAESTDLETRKEDCQITDLDTIVEDVGLTDEEADALSILFDEEDGSIALGTTAELLEYDAETQALALNTALKVVEYYNSATTGDDSAYYVEYEGDIDVTGGTVIIDGAGDLALLLESANYSGIQVASTRTGKTILNVTALNSLDGITIDVLANSDIYLVCTQDDTVTGILSMPEGAELVFTSAETISSVTRASDSLSTADETPGGNTITVGDVRKAVTAFKYVQDLVYSPVYVERGITLDLSGNEDTFPNAAAIIIWEGDDSVTDTAASALSLKSTTDDDDLVVSYNQVLNNLTGDSTARIYLGTGVLTANITSNDEDDRSGLTLGSFAGIISGVGSLVKGGEGTLTLSWSGTPASNDAEDTTSAQTFSGTLEIGEGTVEITGSNGSTSRASAVILDDDTALTLTGSQTIRNLFGSESSSVTLTGGTLTLGANTVYDYSANRPNISNNLGVSDDVTLADIADAFGYEADDDLSIYDNLLELDNSSSRFENSFDLEGNIVGDIVDLVSDDTTQAEATQIYLSCVAKLAYSGFDTSALEDYTDYADFDIDDIEAVAGKYGSGSTEVSFTRLSSETTTETTTDSDGNETTTETTTYSLSSTVTVSRETVLEDLVGLYTELETEKLFDESISTDSDGIYDPSGLLRSFFSSTSDYKAYISGEFTELVEAVADSLDVDLDNISSSSDLAAVNEIYKAVIIAQYEELSAAATTADLTSDFEDLDADEILAKFESDFGDITNLGGTSLLGDEDDDDSYAAQLSELLDGSYTTEEVVALYEEISDAAAEIEYKSLFEGIEISGAFADSVTVDGVLVASEWADELTYAGTITAPSILKDGDNTVTLTGTLITSAIVVEDGILELTIEALTSVEDNLEEGVSVATGAALAIYVEEGDEDTFDFSITGSGGLVKTGDGTLILGDDVLYSGTTTVEGGTLVMTLRESEYEVLEDGTTSVTLAQNDIYLSGDDVTVVLLQDESDVEWINTITSSDEYTGVSVVKDGEYDLEIEDTVSLLGSDASVIVYDGELIIGTLELGSDSSIYIEEGAALELTNLVVDSVALYGAGALRICGTDIEIVGAETDTDSAVKPNGTGYTEDAAFTGTFTVESGASVTLSGESVLSDTRELYVYGDLTIASDQQTMALSGSSAGTVTINEGITLTITPNEERVVADYDTGVYIFDEDSYQSIASFRGTITGDGTLAVSGIGSERLTGTVESSIAVSDGAQIVINAENFSGTASADGTPVYLDDNGNLILDYVEGGSASAVYVETDDEDLVEGFTVRSDGEGFDYAATDGSDGNVKLVANWVIVKTVTMSNGETTEVEIDASTLVAVTDSDGNITGYTAEYTYTDEAANGTTKEVTETETVLTVSDDSDDVYVLASDDCSIAYNWLAETDTGDWSLAELSGDATDSYVAELIFLVDSGTVILDSGTFSFTNDGYFGKVGDGTLSLAGSDFEDAGRVTVYEGRLEVDGWFDTDKVIAEGATLAVTLDVDESPDFSNVMGSGTFELDSQEDITINSSSEATNPLPVSDPTGNGEFFNGTISFVSTDTEYTVYLSGESESDLLEMTTVNTSEGVTLSISNVKFNQSDDSAFEGDVYVTGTVYVEGNTEDSGNSKSDELTRLSVADATSFSIADSTTEFILKNIGFGIGSDQTGITVKIDSDSVSNTFFIDIDEDTEITTETADTGVTYTDGSLVTDGTEISLDLTLTLSASAAIESLSFIKSGEGNLSIDAATLESVGTDNDGDDYDDVFGVEETVYEILGDNNGEFIIGVEEGTLTIDLSDISEDSDGTFTTAVGDVDIEFVTLRSTVDSVSGTLEISVGDIVAASAVSSEASEESSSEESSSGTTTVRAVTYADNSSDSDASPTIVTFAESITGTGNVQFTGSDTAVLTVTAAQTYTGQTTVSGNVDFSGDGRTSSSSLVTVETGATLSGGVVLTGRDVTGSVTAYRNMDDTGDAGETTLTVYVNDSRLGDTIRLRVTLNSDGELLNSDGDLAGDDEDWSDAEIGTWQGVSLSSVAVDDDTVTVTLYDEAIDEYYDVSLSIGTIPSSAGSSSSTGDRTVTIAGNVTVEDNGVIALDVSDGDTIDVGDGTVTFEDGAMLYVSNLSAGVSASLVTAGTITYGDDETGGSAVVEALREWNKTNTDGEDDETYMNLMVYTDSSTGSIAATSLNSDFSSAASYSDGVSGSFLDALSYLASGGEDGDLKYGILDLTDDSSVESSLTFVLNTLSDGDFANEVEKLSPSLYASMLAMPVAAFNSDIQRIRERLNQRRYDGGNPLRETDEYEFFVFTEGDFAHNANNDDSPTFDFNLFGATAGVDWKPDFTTTLGLAAGYTYGKAQARHSGGKIEMDDVRVTAFFGKMLGRIFIDGGIQAGTAHFDADRKTAAGHSRADTDSYFGGVFATVGTLFTLYYDKKTGEGLYLVPSVGLSYFHTEIDEFSENGLAGLDMDDSDGDSLRLRVAAGLQWGIPFDVWEVRLGAEIAYEHEFCGDELDLDGSFTAGGPSFSTSPNAMASDVFSLGPTIDVMLSQQSSVFAGYELRIGTDESVSQGANIGFRHRF